MIKTLIGVVAAVLATSTSFAIGAQNAIQKRQLPKAIKVIWDGGEFTTSDEKEIEQILTSDLVNNPEVIIKNDEAAASQPTTICVVKEQ